MILIEKILKLSDNLSSTLQNQETTAAEGQAVAELTVTTLKTMCSIGIGTGGLWELHATPPKLEKAPYRFCTERT